MHTMYGFCSQKQKEQCQGITACCMKNKFNYRDTKERDGYIYTDKIPCSLMSLITAIKVNATKFTATFIRVCM